MGGGGTGAYAEDRTGRQADPDMEQILASIRKIIADDQKALGMPLETVAQPASRRRAPAQSAVAPQGVADGRVSAEPRGYGARVSHPQRVAARPVATPQAAQPFVSAPQVFDDGADDDGLHDHLSDHLDMDLQRMGAGAAHSRDIETGLPPRVRPPVRLGAAPSVDYRPPDARARRGDSVARAHGVDTGIVDQRVIDERLAEVIRRAVVEQVGEVAQEALGAGARSGMRSDRRANPAMDSDFAPADMEQADHARNWGQQDARQEEAWLQSGSARRADSNGYMSGPVAVVHAREAAGSLVTPATAVRIAGAFDALSQRVVAERTRTMEETVTDMLRPMLADWLEANLPEIVERLVAEQVERLSRGDTDRR